MSEAAIVENPSLSGQPTSFPTVATRDLVACYLDAARSAGTEPFISVMPLLRLYAYLIAWEFGVILLPLVGVVNGAIWIIRRIRRTSAPAYISAWAWVWSVRAAKSLHQGEVPLLKALVSRNLIRLFSLLHMRRRVRALAAGMRLEYVEACIAHDHARIQQAEADQKFAETTAAGVTDRAELKGLLIIVGAAELLGTMARFVPQGLKTSVTAWFGHTLPLLGIGSVLFESRNGSPVAITLAIISFISYLLIVVLSCVVRKREIFLTKGVYEAESIVRSTLRVELPREVPLDLFGFLILVNLPIAALVFREIHDPGVWFSSEDWRAMLVMSSLYSAPIIYAAVRRLMRDHR